MYFESNGEKRPKPGKNTQFYKFGAMDEYLIQGKSKKLFWKIKDIKEVHPRRYNAIESSVEVFLKNGKVYFLNLYERLN